MAHLKLIWPSLRHQKGLYLLWLLSLAIAVSGLVITDVYRQSLTQTLTLQGRKILTADIALTARRRLTDEEQKIFKDQLRQASAFAQMNELFAMVSHGSDSRLAMIRFIDNEFPLVGDLHIDSGGSIQNRKGLELQGRRLAWAAADLLTLMNLKVGDRVQIGRVEFTIAGVVKKDSSQTFRMGNMAPRIYVHLENLKPTQLVQFGSTFSETHYARFDSDPSIEYKQALERQFPETGINVLLPKDLEQGSFRLLSGIMDYLGLIGLVTLSLGWIGVYFLGRRWLTLEVLAVGILKALGLTPSEMRLLLVSKLFAILTLGSLAGGILSWLAAVFIFPWLKNSLPGDFSLLWTWQNSLLLVAVGPLCGLLLLLPPLNELVNENPLSLLQGTLQRRLKARTLLFLVLLVFATFLGLTWFQAKSWVVTRAFLGSVALSIGVAAGLSSVLIYWLRTARKRFKSWPLILASAIWVRRWNTTLLLISVSTLASLLAQLVPHIERTLVGELKTPQQMERPSLFLFDIQDEQLEPLQDFLKTKNIDVSEVSPFIRARILSVNDKNFERGELTDWSTREEEVETRFRNRGVNLSYRSVLTPSEKIVAGKNWADHTASPSEISVEERYAQRLGLAIGDRIRFDVQSVEVEAIVQSLREVDWNSFQPNFFIQFPAGVLNDAPKTWIMTLKRNSTLNAPQIQVLVTQKFPNVTSINVEETIDNVTDLITKLSAGLKIASRLTLALGIFVFLMVLLFQLASLRPDWVQLRLQGLRNQQIWLLQVITYGTMGALGALVGAVLAAAVAWGIAQFAFNSRVHFDWVGSMGVLFTLWLAVILGISWFSYRDR